MKINFECYRGMEKGGGSWLLLQVSPRTTHGLGTAPVVGARPTLLTPNTDWKGNIYTCTVMTKTMTMTKTNTREGF